MSRLRSLRDRDQPKAAQLLPVRWRPLSFCLFWIIPIFFSRWLSILKLPNPDNDTIERPKWGCQRARVTERSRSELPDTEEGMCAGDSGDLVRTQPITPFIWSVRLLHSSLLLVLSSTSNLFTGALFLSEINIQPINLSGLSKGIQENKGDHEPKRSK